MDKNLVFDSSEFMRSPQPAAQCADELKLQLSQRILRRYSDALALNVGADYERKSLSPSGFWKMGLTSKTSSSNRIELSESDLSDFNLGDSLKVNSACEPWSSSGLEILVRQLGWDSLDPSWKDTDNQSVQDNLTQASEMLKMSWPEAHSEIGALVNQVIFTKAPLRSSTMFGTYGAIWSGPEELATPETAFELLLHEQGHHSLLLREQFTHYLENPNDMAHHALRTDVRPLRGVFHAAFVLWRITNGMHRALDLQSGRVKGIDTVSMSARLAYLDEWLEETLVTLDRTAKWTDMGRLLREELSPTR